MTKDIGIFNNSEDLSLHFVFRVYNNVHHKEFLTIACLIDAININMKCVMYKERTPLKGDFEYG